MAIGGVTNTGTHPKLLWPGVYETWGQIYDEHAKEYEMLWNVHDSDKAYEQLVQVTGYGLAQVKPEGTAGSYDSEVQGVISTIQHIPYSLGWIVTYEELRDNQYEIVATRRAEANAFSVNQTLENIGVFPYNNAFASTYFATADGQPLCSTAHVQATGGTFSNALSPAADLSEASIEDLTIQIMGATTDRGMLFSLIPESLHVPRQEWFNANRILKSVLQSNTANNNINVLKATNAFPKGILLNHYFTSAHAWFIRTNCPAGMYFFWRDKPDLQRDNDFDTKNAKALTYFRCSVGVGDPRALYGSNGP
jgi:hypothetical protein